MWKICGLFLHVEEDFQVNKVTAVQSEYSVFCSGPWKEETQESSDATAVELLEFTESGFRPLITQFACFGLVPKKQWTHLLHHLEMSAKFYVSAIWRFDNYIRVSSINISMAQPPFHRLRAEYLNSNTSGLPQLYAAYECFYWQCIKLLPNKQIKNLKSS